MIKDLVHASPVQDGAPNGQLTADEALAWWMRKMVLKERRQAMIRDAIRTLAIIAAAFGIIFGIAHAAGEFDTLMAVSVVAR